MKLPIYQVDAFSTRLFGGNPAAVIPLEEWLPDEVLQSIAEENNLSETAFYVNDGADLHLRWFTPVAEVDLCGHATLASAYIYFAEEGLEEGEVTFQSRSGPLIVEKKGERITMDFPAQPVTGFESPPGLREALGDSGETNRAGPDVMVVFETETAVASLSPDFSRLRNVKCRGVIATAPGDAAEVDFVSRFFAPAFGVDEDPVTGSAHCALAPFWANRLGKKELEAVQISGRTGQLHCRVDGDRVFISGTAVPFLRGEIVIPGK